MPDLVCESHDEHCVAVCPEACRVALHIQPNYKAVVYNIAMIPQKSADMLFGLPTRKPTLNDLKLSIEQATNAQTYVATSQYSYVVCTLGHPGAGKCLGTSLRSCHTCNEADCQWKIPCQIKEFFDAGIIMTFIGDLNEGLPSSHIGKWLERGQEGAGPFDFGWSLSTSEGDL
ncbi:hypothetical protein C8J57DRAFT_1581252 [Mycena rebaudengoi]|nr:hypothetical protein C8J57DRAFT_1581252 [Mycena rebaudengoi]